MKPRIAFPAALLLAILAAPGPVAQAQGREPFVVTTTWLSEHIHDKSLVLLHVGDEAEFKTEHLPGAQYVSMRDLSKSQSDGLTMQLPPPAEAQALFERLGISDNSRIVVYMGKDWVTPTARTFLTLESIGLGAHASILDGGLPAWRKEGGAVTAEVTAPAPGKLTPHPQDVVVTAEWVNAHLQDASVAIVDARDTQFYNGSSAGRMPRAGHIPGARSIPFPDVVVDETNKLKDPAALREIFAAANVKPGQMVVTYCHIGQQASLVYFAARTLGYDARVFDGSFEEWSKRSEFPVETPEQPAQPPGDPRDGNPGYDLAGMYRHHFNKVTDQFSTGGQPPIAELAHLKEQGFKVIVDLQEPSEHNALAEAAEAERLGMRYVNIPVVYGAPKDEQATEFLKLTDDAQNLPMFIHCTMAVRASAFWMIRRVLRDGWSVADAQAEAERLGLGARHLREFAVHYIEQHRGEAAARK